MMPHEELHSARPQESWTKTRQGAARCAVGCLSRQLHCASEALWPTWRTNLLLEDAEANNCTRTAQASLLSLGSPTTLPSCPGRASAKRHKEQDSNTAGYRRPSVCAGAVKERTRRARLSTLPRNVRSSNEGNWLAIVTNLRPYATSGEKQTHTMPIVSMGGFPTSPRQRWRRSLSDEENDQRPGAYSRVACSPKRPSSACTSHSACLPHDARRGKRQLLPFTSSEWRASTSVQDTTQCTRYGDAA